MGKYRILVVGAGSIGERHTRCFIATGRAEVAICEPREARRAEVAERYPLVGAYRLLDEAPLDEFDCLVVCVPAHLHVPMAMRGLEAGCHLLIEKPLALTLGEAEEMAEAAESAGTVVGVAYTYRSMPFLQDMKRAVEEGHIGPVRQAVAVWGQHFPLYRPDYKQIYYRSPETGGGALQDAATHIINYMQWVLGLERTVYCAAEHLVLEGVEVEDTVAIVCKYPGRAISTICLNQFQWNNDGLIELAGEAGTVRFVAAQMRLSLYTDGEWRDTEYHCERDDYYIWQAHNFLDAIEGKGSVLCTVRQALETVRTVVAAQRSWDEGREVVVR